MTQTRSATNVDAIVGQRVRLRRIELGISQEVLAGKLGVTFQQVQKYELGKNRIGASRLHQIATVLEVPIQHFFGGIEADGTPANFVPLPTERSAHVYRRISQLTDAQQRKVLELVEVIAPAGRMVR